MGDCTAYRPVVSCRDTIQYGRLHCLQTCCFMQGYHTVWETALPTDLLFHAGIPYSMGDCTAYRPVVSCRDTIQYGRLHCLQTCCFMQGYHTVWETALPTDLLFHAGIPYSMGDCTAYRPVVSCRDTIQYGRLHCLQTCCFMQGYHTVWETALPTDLLFHAGIAYSMEDCTAYRPVVSCRDTIQYGRLHCLQTCCFMQGYHTVWETALPTDLLFHAGIPYSMGDCTAYRPVVSCRDSIQYGRLHCLQTCCFMQGYHTVWETALPTDLLFHAGIPYSMGDCTAYRPVVSCRDSIQYGRLHCLQTCCFMQGTQ